MKIAAYIRCSTDEQDRDKQRITTNEWCTRKGYGVPDIYEEVGRRYEGLNRPILSKLMSRAHDYDIICVENLDRVGFRDALQLMHILYLLRESNCELWLASDDKEVLSDNIGSMVLNTVAGENSRSECVGKAKRLFTKARDYARAGKFLGGATPYGLDLGCFVGDQLQWRSILIGPKTWTVDGVVYKGYLCARPPDSYMQWLPSEDPERLAVVRAVYEQAAEGIPFYRIATILTQRGIKHPLGYWYANRVQRMVQNPAYIGFPTWNKTTRATYAQYRDGLVHEDVIRPNNRDNVPTDLADRIAPEKPVYTPLVSKELFEAAQSRFTNPPAQPRGPRSASLYLTGLLYCQKCGRPMVGWHPKAKTASYLCASFRRFGKDNPSGCGNHQLRAVVIEAVIDRYLDQVKDVIAPVSESGADGLLALLDDQAKSSRLELRQLGDAMREYAAKELGASVLGLSFVELWEEVSLAENARRSNGKARRVELEGQLRGLVQTWQELSGEYAKRIAQEEIARVEAEIASLDARPEFSRQIHRLSKQLVDVYVAVSRARKEQNPLAKSKLLRKLLQRIDCSFTFREVANGKLYAKLDRVDFHPLEGDAFTAYSSEWVGRCTVLRVCSAWPTLTILSRSLNANG